MNNDILSILPSRYISDGGSGSGGFSEVFYCTDMHLNRKVAIKTIKHVEDVKRLEDEIKGLLQVRSKHVVQVFDLIRSDTPKAIIMEYIDGVELIYPNFQITSDIHLLKTLWQIASGISDIHDVEMIHRDIKPNNMKLDEEGIIKIFDFGLSRNSNLNAMTMGFVGTRGFSAPELYTHEEVSFTSAIDVYSFGITVLYLATKSITPPLLQMPPDEASKGCFDCDYLNKYPTLKLLFEKCLNTDPKKRPSMKEVKDKISEYLTVDKHQAILVSDGKTPYTLNASKRSVKISYGMVGSFEIFYDGLRFVLRGVIGEVYINNIKAENNDEIGGSCVIGLGSSNRPFKERSFMTFDVSSPEVTL